MDAVDLTVAILTLDEADRVAAAIRSASFADEVLVLDSGSRDDTVAVAESLGARVLRTDWPGFVAQRNRALAEARGRRVFFLDADERISDELARSIRSASGPGRVRRLNHWQGRPVSAGCFGPTWIVRLCERGAGRWVGEGVHEVLQVEAPSDLQGLLEHHPYRSPEEHWDTIDRYATLFAQHSTRRAGLSDLALRPPLHFVKSLLLLGGLREGRLGLRLAWMGAAHVALKWGRLYRRQR